MPDDEIPMAILVEDENTARMAALRERWLAEWPAALAAWSRYTQLSLPRWCETIEEEKTEHLVGSFAMIRLVDHAVVISLRQVAEQRLDAFAVEILAHEIGHHVYCPADLTDNARLIARIRAGLPTREQHAPLIANLYTDLLINDRLQRSAGLDMAGVYRALDVKGGDRLWTLYMRIYEILWSLPRMTLATGLADMRLQSDAALGARLIRSYARDWLDGAGRFACLCLPYLLGGETDRQEAGGWHDTREAGRDGLPNGLAEVDPAERSGAIHPSEDPALSGTARSDDSAGKGSEAKEDGTGRKSIKQMRGPVEYGDLIKASGATLDPARLVARYYRELALPHLIRFPVRTLRGATEPLPEGLDRWEIGSAFDSIDWLGSMAASPTVIPGFTLRERTYGEMPGTEPASLPLDLYLGVDCSGSMQNPANYLSYPILAGTIVALSALRAGASVKVVLSGEPGRTIATDGFIRDESAVLAMLTNYLGCGMTFGIHRLAETFATRTAQDRPAHVLIVTDNDIFTLLDAKQETGEGWTVARESLNAAGGGGTMVLQLPAYLLNDPRSKTHVNPGCERLSKDGWTVANVDSMDGLLTFARAFSTRTYSTDEPAQGGQR